MKFIGTFIFCLISFLVLIFSFLTLFWLAESFYLLKWTTFPILSEITKSQIRFCLIVTFITSLLGTFELLSKGR